MSIDSANICEMFYLLQVLYTVAILEHWALGMIFLAIDLTGKPHFITKYKVQLDETEVSLLSKICYNYKYTSMALV